MPALRGCPKCYGAVLCDGFGEPLCICCGWRPVALSEDVKLEVQKYWGKRQIGHGNSARKIATGKPPASGWQRELRRREKEAEIYRTT